MHANFLLVGAVTGFLGVAIGAFGAHGLRTRLSPEMLAVFEIGVRYQMYHAFALLVVALVAGRAGHVRLLTIAGWSFIAGIVIFSGSLYALALTGTTTFGAITPIGGAAFLIGWGCLGAAGAKGVFGPKGA
jgi:uncharacterized membrane protein YgdD (TMEM256/DUF423 family)